MKIISGGQSGVDRAALDFCLENNIECGGWCPKGRLAEDGVIDRKYPLNETPERDYAFRTRLNVLSADATLLLYLPEPDKGSLLTIEVAESNAKQILKVDLEKADINDVRSWLSTRSIKVLNIAGPRESSCPGIYLRSKKLLEQIFRKD